MNSHCELNIGRANKWGCSAPEGSSFSVLTIRKVCSLESLLLCCNCSKLIEDLITQCTKKPIKVREAATPTAPPEESNLKEGSFWVWVTWPTLYATDELSLLISRDRWGSESAPPAHEQVQVSQRGWPDLPSPWAPWREDSGVHAKSPQLFPTLLCYGL